MSETGGKIVLFVEDDAVVLAAYRLGIEKAGYHIEAAVDGIEAMRKLSLFAPDVIILDLMLPRFNGAEVLKFMRKTPRLAAVPVIVFSTNSVVEGGNEQLMQTAFRRLIKTNCTPAIMLQAITDALAKPAKPDEAKPAQPEPDKGTPNIRF